LRYDFSAPIDRPDKEGRMSTTSVRSFFFAFALFSVATTSHASTITYNFSARIDLATAFTDLTLESVHTGDVLHGTMTVDTSLPDTNASADVGQYTATSAPAVLTLTIGPYGQFPQEIYSTSSFLTRIAENGSGLFSNEELLVLLDTPFQAFGNLVDTFEVRLDSDSLSFLNGTGFPAAVDLGLLNGHSIFEFGGHNATQTFEGFEFFGSITEFRVATDTVPEPASGVFVAGGLVTLLVRRRQSS